MDSKGSVRLAVYCINSRTAREKSSADFWKKNPTWSKIGERIDFGDFFPSNSWLRVRAAGYGGRAAGCRTLVEGVWFVWGVFVVVSGQRGGVISWSRHVVVACWWAVTSRRRCVSIAVSRQPRRQPGKVARVREGKGKNRAQVARQMGTPRGTGVPG